MKLNENTFTRAVMFARIEWKANFAHSLIQKKFFLEK